MNSCLYFCTVDNCSKCLIFILSYQLFPQYQRYVNHVTIQILVKGVYCAKCHCRSNPSIPCLTLTLKPIADNRLNLSRTLLTYAFRWFYVFRLIRSAMRCCVCFLTLRREWSKNNRSSTTPSTGHSSTVLSCVVVL